MEKEGLVLSAIPALPDRLGLRLSLQVSNPRNPVRIDNFCGTTEEHTGHGALQLQKGLCPSMDKALQAYLLIPAI